MAFKLQRNWGHVTNNNFRRSFSFVGQRSRYPRGSSSLQGGLDCRFKPFSPDSRGCHIGSQRHIGTR